MFQQFHQWSLGGPYPAGDVDEMIFADEEYSVSQR
jgi:hypothetical protein